MASHYRPRTDLETHEVTNQPPPRLGRNAFADNVALRDVLKAAGGGSHLDALTDFGAKTDSEEARELSRAAQENPPKLKSFDRYGQRLDEVEFHPAYHELMRYGLEGGVSAAGWNADEGGHVLHASLLYLMSGMDAGVCCPMSMTYAAVPALRTDPKIAARWEPLIREGRYDGRFLPAEEKTGVTIGMAMTEKQGGSDVRANTTKAEKTADGYLLTGHKWFCSAPMSDAFLTLAYAQGGLNCFLVPRWRPDGTRNPIHIMRLKDKLGDRSNASSEIEYHGAWAERLGEEGKGVRTIIQMVQHTRLDCIAGSAGGMRAALTEAVWHTAHRSAFQKKLIDQPAMRSVLTDLALESEAATALMIRVARSFDLAASSPLEAALMRIATPIAKYWICKRQPGFVYEALECFGGVGYVEEGPMPRLFRQSPLNAIWEGSGNVIALDVLRALSREHEAMDALRTELLTAKGVHALYDAHLARLEAWAKPGALTEVTARAFVEEQALGLQAAALHLYAPEEVFADFCAARLDPENRHLAYGALPSGLNQDRIIARALPIS
ncbi:acyl-CoA dehydrogenase family protein [Parvularcula marina]|uniref:acyl-CoA dehydrogenase family protein n=1 Tax=Parvularcula marina TaxID=2292771 RepID=UPI003518C61C